MRRLDRGRSCGGYCGDRRAVRTPIGKRGGVLAGLHAAEILGARADRAAGPGRASTRPASSRSPAAASPRPASSPATSPGPPGCTPGCRYQTGCLTLDAQCGSAQQAVHLVAGLIAADAIESASACGVEAMSRVPLGRQRRHRRAARPGPPPGTSTCRTSSSPPSGSPQRRGLTRADLDAFGLRSQTLAAARLGARAGSTARSCRSRRRSWTPTASRPARPASSTATRACARPAWRRWPGSGRCSTDGLHTAGTSSQISDGAAAVLLLDARPGRASSACGRGPGSSPSA